MVKQDAAKAKLLRNLREGYHIPSLSVIAVKLVQLAADEKSSAKDLAELIEEDPALSARLLRLANSAFFKGHAPMASLQQAVTRVGFHRLRIMALSLSLRNSFPMGKVGPMDYEKFWRTSMYRALLTKSLAEELKIGDPEEAFSAGLTMEIGLLVFFDLFIKDKTKDKTNEIDLEHDSLPELLSWQLEHYGIDHRQIGEVVLRQWNFPDNIVDCQQWHRFTDLRDNVSEFIKIVCLAMELTRLVFMQSEDYQSIFVEAQLRFKLSQEKINAIVQESFTQMQEIADGLGNDHMQNTDLLQVVEQARLALNQLINKKTSGAGQEELLSQPESPTATATKKNRPKKHSGVMTKGTIMFGRYRLENLLGQGSMGSVYLAYDNKLARQVAIKTLRMDRMRSREERRLVRNYFLQEARVTANMNHRHITTIYDIGIEKGLPYLIMEYIEGDNLKKLIDEKVKFALSEKIAIISMVAQALNYAHQRGILHRDVKPANVMILKNRLPKIMDFGIARIIEAKSGGNLKNMVDAEEIMVGSPIYMSPEQVKNLELDHRSDIFSLGVLAYTWISFLKPFKAGSTEEILQAVVSRTPLPLSEVSDADKELEKIINRAIAKDPEKRFQNAEDFSDALELYMDNVSRKSQHGMLSDFHYNKKKIMENLRKKYMFFANFSMDELFIIFKLASQETFKNGEYVIREGTNGTKLYVIISGSMAVVQEVEGRDIEVNVLPAGSCVGEMAILDRMPRSASVIAREPTHALAINETVLRYLEPKLCLKLYRNLGAIISERLRNLDTKYRHHLSSKGP